jgi:hypothetical protein
MYGSNGPDPFSRPGPRIGALQPFSDNEEDLRNQEAEFFSRGLEAQGQVIAARNAQTARERAAKAAGRPSGGGTGGALGAISNVAGAVTGVVGAVAAI